MCSSEVAEHIAACSAQSELFFRLLLKNTVRRVHIAAYHNFLVASKQAHNYTKQEVVEELQVYVLGTSVLAICRTLLRIQITNEPQFQE